jgi:hypothetical protein
MSDSVNGSLLGGAGGICISFCKTLAKFTFPYTRRKYKRLVP